MKQFNLPFKIDKQYEYWQFELEALDDRFYGYHSYRYIGKKFNNFLNYPTDKTELIFNGDYLTAVIIIIKNGNIKKLNAILLLLIPNASKIVSLDEQNKKFKIKQVVYFVRLDQEKKKLIIIYGKPKFVNEHIITLID